MNIDRESIIPIHYQITELLRNQIKQGIYNPGSMLPSEFEIMKKLGVSRTTVRQALNNLVSEGVIRREPGRGTFVLEPRIRSEFSKLDSFTHDIQRLGKKPGSILLEKNYKIPNMEIAKYLGVKENDPLLTVTRLRTADDEPIAIATSWLNQIYVPELEKLDYQGLSIYQTFISIGLVLKRASTRVWADLANFAELSLLQMQPGSPVLRLRRLTYIELEKKEVTIEYVEATFNGYMYSVEY